MITLWNLLVVFGLLSLLAIGGGNAVLPALQHVVVNQYQWLTPDQFREMYSLGQISPGPNLLMVLLIGYYLKGLAGALVVGIGFFIPDCILAWSIHRLWQHFATSPWLVAIQRGLAPVVIGLMLAGVFMLGKLTIVNWSTFLLAIMTIVILTFSRINPTLVILLAGLIELLVDFL